MQSRSSKVLALSFGKALAGIMALVAAGVLSRMLSERDYATYRQTLLAMNFVAPIILLGLPDAIFFFLPSERKRRRAIVFENLILLTAMGGLLSSFLMLGGNRLLAWRFDNPHLVVTLRYFVPYPILFFPASALAACLVVQGRVTSQMIYQILTKMMLVACIIASCSVWQNADAPLIANVLVAALSLPIAVWLMFSSLPSDSWRPNPKSMWATMKYSVPLGIATMVTTISLQLDKVIVSSMCPPEDFAIYANGAMEIPLIAIITGSITAVFLADMRKSVAASDFSEAVRLFRVCAEKSSWMLLPTMVFLLIGGDACIETLFSNKYSDSAIPFRLYLLALPVRIVVFGAMLMALGKTRLVMWRALGHLSINLLLGLLLVREIGYLGAAIATIATTWLWSVPYNLYTISKTLNMKWTYLIPFPHLGRLLGLMLFPASMQLVAAAISRSMSPVLRLTIEAVAFWPLVIIWWNGQIYSTARIKKEVCRIFGKGGHIGKVV